MNSDVQEDSDVAQFQVGDMSQPENVTVTDSENITDVPLGETSTAAPQNTQAPGTTGTDAPLGSTEGATATTSTSGADARLKSQMFTLVVLFVWVGLV